MSVSRKGHLDPPCWTALHVLAHDLQRPMGVETRPLDPCFASPGPDLFGCVDPFSPGLDGWTWWFPSWDLSSWKIHREMHPPLHLDLRDEQGERSVRGMEREPSERDIAERGMEREGQIHRSTPRRWRMVLWRRTFLWFAAAFLLALGATSRGRPAATMGLKPCPSSPNCVSSEADKKDKEHYVAPLTYSGLAPEDALKKLRDVVGKMSRAKLVEEHDLELHYTFTTLIFRFVDDVNLLVVPDRSSSQVTAEGTSVQAEPSAPSTSGTVQVRSASRVGYSDLGTNRRRVEEIRKLWNEAERDTHASKM